MYEVVIAGVHAQVEQLMVDAAGMLDKGCIDVLEFMVLVADIGERCTAGRAL